MCLTTLDLEDFFSQSFFAFEKWKEKMKKNDAVLTSMKCKMDQEKTGASFPLIREIDISGKSKRIREKDVSGLCEIACCLMSVCV